MQETAGQALISPRRQLTEFRGKIRATALMALAGMAGTCMHLMVILRDAPVERTPAVTAKPLHRDEGPNRKYSDASRAACYSDATTGTC